MRIAEVMTRDVAVVHPGDSLRRAAWMMDNLNVGALPVCDGDRLVGMITDRDITVRASAAGRSPEETRVAEAMSSRLRWCFADDDVEQVVRKMGDSQIRRVPVVDKQKRLVGIISLGDLAAEHAPGAEEALERISTPAVPDREAS